MIKLFHEKVESFERLTLHAEDQRRSPSQRNDLRFSNQDSYTTLEEQLSNFTDHWRSFLDRDTAHQRFVDSVSKT